MTTYYLRADGSNSNTGLGQTAGTAWLTLSFACTTMVAGDRLEVMDAGGVFYLGTEHSFKPVGSVGNLVTITNFSGQSPIFDGSPPGGTGTHSGNANILLVAAGSTYFDVGGFTVRNNNESVTNRGRGFSVSSAISPAKVSNGILRNITVHNTYLRGFGVCGTTVAVVSCEVYDAAMSNEFNALGSGGWATGFATVIQSDNSSPTGISFSLCYSHENWGEGFDALQADGVTFDRCISANNFSVLFYLDRSKNIEYERCLALFNDPVYYRSGNPATAYMFAAEGSGTPVPNFSPANVDAVLYTNCIAVGARREFHYFHSTGNTSANNTYRNIRIYGCSGYGTTEGGFDMDDVDGAHTAPSLSEFIDCITYGTPVESDAAAWTFENNNYADGVPVSGTHTDCIEDSAPYQAPVTTGNTAGFQLKSTSTCIGAGQTLAELAVDYDGETRLVPTAIGALEFLDPPLTAPTGVFTVPVSNGVWVFWEAVSGAYVYNVYYKAGGTVTTSDPSLPDFTSPKFIPSLTEWTDYTFGVTALDSGLSESVISTTVTTQPGLTNPTMFGVMINPVNYPYTTFAVRGTWWRQTTGVTLATATTQNVVQAMLNAADTLGIVLKLWLTVRWNGSSGAPDTGPIGATEISTWKTNLGLYIDNYSPQVIAVLNEEPSALFSSLTSAQYLAALEAAWDIANPRGVLVTNGGLVWSGAALCYYAHLLEDVSTGAAHTFASIAFPAGADRTDLETATVIADLSAPLQTAISKNRDFLLNVYQATSKMDYMCIHVHWPEVSAGIDAIRQVFQWYESETGLRVVTNESNNEGQDAALTVELMELYMELDTPIVMQYSVTTGQSISLQDTTGALRDTGEAWRDAIVQLEIDRTPTGLAAVGSVDEVTLSSDAMTNTHGYAVYYRAGSSVAKSNGTRVEIETNPDTLTGLFDPFTQYAFGISAIRYGGEGLFLSNIVTAFSTSGGGSVIPGSGSAGAAETTYFIRINDAFGNPMPDVGALYSLQVAQTVGSVGSATIVIPGEYPIDYLKKDGLIEIWRHPQGRQPYLLFNKIFYLRRRVFSVSGGQKRWTLTAYDPNYLLASPAGNRGRIVAYAANTAYASKSDFADDMIKAIARENVGSLATDTARSLASLLNIQADISGAPNIVKAFSNRVLLPVFNEICQASTIAGTYLAWDIVCTAPPLNGSYTLELRTYLNQRGVDHRFSSNQPVLIGLDFGNLDDVTIDEDWSEEADVARVGGKGEGELRAYGSASDSVRLGESPVNRREIFVNQSNISDPLALSDEADSAIRAGYPRPAYHGRIVPTAQALFDVNWKYGDYLTAQVVGRSFDARADSLVVKFGPDGERIEGYLRGEDVIPS